MTDVRSPAERYRIALLVDVRLFRDGLVRVLSAVDELEVVAAGPVTESGFAVIEAAHPDVVMLEASAAREPAFVRTILTVLPASKVIAFAIGDDEQDAILCAEAGVAGYVSREASIEELVAIVLRVQHGEFPCTPRVAALLARRVSSLAAARVPAVSIPALTPREREVLRLIDQGFSNKEIAKRLGIGVSTVKNHVHNILDKTHTSGRGEAAARTRPPVWIFGSRPLPERI